MKKLIFAAVTVMALSAIAPAQNGTYTTQSTSTITSGPWHLRASTGDKMLDRMWFIADRTLNSAEMDDIKMMLRNMQGNTSYTMEKAIVHAIDNNAKANSSYSMWPANDWATDNGLSDYQIYDAMYKGLDWQEKAVLDQWLSTATASQMSAVAKLIRMGGWANSIWTTSGMESH
jgi:hypothetical protein